jgi:two-component system response regulator FixJ
VDNRIGPVAIVDDDPAVLDSLRFLLEVAGHRVAVFASAAQYLAQYVANCGPRPTCLIVDQHMPGMTGLELIARLRISGAEVPAMLVTGSSSRTIVTRAAELGIERVLDKPPTEDVLLTFVEAHRGR